MPMEKAGSICAQVDDAEEQGREKYCIYWPNAVS